MRRPGAGLGALVGLLASAALAALLFLAQRVWGAPFPPFDLFDALARGLPGPVVTFGIDAIVDAILFLNLGPVADVAKPAEQALAIALFLAAGAAVGAILFAALRGRGARDSLWPAALTGLALGAGALLASLGAGAGTARPVPDGAWLLGAFLAWGATLGWSRARLTEMAADATATSAPATAERLDRRRFLIRLGGASAVVTVAGAGVGALLRGGRGDPGPAAERTEGWSATNPLPNASADVSPAPGTRPEYTLPEDHYRIDINTFTPGVDGEAWALRVDGLVDGPAEFALDDLRAYEPLHQFITMSCISNRLGGDLISTTRWTGVPLRRLLSDIGLRPQATHLRISSVDGFYEYLPIATALVDERVMLTYAWDGRPLPQRNGYPLRIYVPDVYGMKQPKWIDRIEAVDAWAPGFWVERGWDAEARMHATSVIDTIATDAIVAEGNERRVPIGGIAHAGARGIDRVEVRVDDGDWREARLREPLSGLTWVVWRYDWPFQEGEHTITVRCIDGNGDAQIEERTSVRPDGATGLLSERVTL